MSIDVLFSFDTTGSMFPCLTEVRRKVKEAVKILFDDIPHLRIGVITHGDYCDGGEKFSMWGFDKNVNNIVSYVETAPKTNGGDSSECYEYVLRQAWTKFDWRADKRVLVLIADDVPHEIHYHDNFQHLDWRKEALELIGRGVNIYTVQCLNKRYATSFYNELAKLGEGHKLDLNQFSDIVEFISAICYQQAGQLERYTRELEGSFKLNRSIATMLENLGSKIHYTRSSEATHSGLISVNPNRFQLLHVDKRIPIKDFVEDTGAEFKRGRGFYQLSKAEDVQERKEVVLRDKVTGDMFTGDEARDFIGIPYGTRGRVHKMFDDKFDIFIQSTSNNRILISDTMFLYEVG